MTDMSKQFEEAIRAVDTHIASYRQVRALLVRARDAHLRGEAYDPRALIGIAIGEMHESGDYGTDPPPEEASLPFNPDDITRIT